MKNSNFSVLYLFFVIACVPVKKINPLPTVFDVEGHRGCRGLMPENTIPAMLKAVDLGVNTLEMDAVITADDQVILSHEPFFNHDITTKSDGTMVEEKEERQLNIYKMTYQETLAYDVGMKAHPRFPHQQKMHVNKPLLSMVFDAVETKVRDEKKPLPFYNIETKTTPATDYLYHPPPARFVQLLIEVIKKHQMEDRVVIQSFDIRTLKELHHHYPHIRTALLVENSDTVAVGIQLNRLGFTPTIYSPHFSLVTPALIKLCHDQKMRVVPWTVNDQASIVALKNLGVDGIISDYPDLFKQ